METQTARGATGYPTAANPNLATPAQHEKKGMAEKVKGLLGGHGHKTTDAAHQTGVYGDATPATGTAQSTRVGCLDKIKSKAGIGHAEQQQHHHQGDFTDPSASPDFNGGTNINSSAAVHGGWPHPTNPHQSVSSPPNPNNHGYTDPQPTNPTGLTNAEGGAVLGDEHGNMHQGPRDDHAKKEGLVSKIMDKLHSPKGKPAQTATTTPASY